MTLCSHLVVNYRSIPVVPVRSLAGLAPWQTRRVTELLSVRLDVHVTLAMLAAECGLSVSHFARSFKKTFGTSVHRYLLMQRVKAAKVLLVHSNQRLSDIAFQTGFADQAAFTRTFGGIVGTTPGRWRNEHGHKE
jgi:AraC family transcriptional regulator